MGPTIRLLANPDAQGYCVKRQEQTLREEKDHAPAKQEVHAYFVLKRSVDTLPQPCTNNYNFEMSMGHGTTHLSRPPGGRDGRFMLRRSFPLWTQRRGKLRLTAHEPNICTGIAATRV
jgi:hypothetical protein